MAFGQSSGPPATHTQMRRLTELLEAAGHTDFRDARGPLGLTQRQAGGKFTRDEADTLITQLELEAEQGDGPGPDDTPADDAPADDPPATPTRAGRTSLALDRRAAEQRRALRRMPTEMIAAELQSRGWVVLEP